MDGVVQVVIGVLQLVLAWLTYNKPPPPPRGE
jgi:hypothetical protein